MKKEYNYYLQIVKKISTSEMAEFVELGEDMVRKYKAGRNLPPLDKAILLKQRYSIPCEFWVQHNREYKIAKGK